jgi:D-beta-D-heptose 7-phosphate kinase/D-beta-D-heptose 1-phosphate adenosyltransferase
MAKVLVIGESCIDRFVYCDADRLAPDVPVPVLTRRHAIENDGMAANVRANLYDLGCKGDLYTQPNWMATTKTRYVHRVSNHTFLRVDAGHEFITRIEFNENFFTKLSEYDAIAISDYNKGFLTYDDISRIAHAHPLVFLDTKKKITNMFGECAYIKINTPEYNASRAIIDSSPHLSNRTIVTAGADGCYFRREHYPTTKVNVSDVAGAGDTFFAALIASYVTSFVLKDSIEFANKCAATVVQQRGVNTVKF